MKGCISLGAETDLVRRRRKSDDAELEIHRTVRPERMPVWKDIPLDMSYPEWPFEYELQPSPHGGEVTLSGAGLNQLYVCFGAPGTGKSYLLLRILKQMLLGDWAPPWGGLLLDPKQTLIADVGKLKREIEEEGGKLPADRFHTIGPHEASTNLLCGKMGQSRLGPYDLGVALALAAQSAGISAKEPFWLNEMKRIFGAGLNLLELLGEPQTLNRLAELLLAWELVEIKDLDPQSQVKETQTTLDQQLDSARKVVTEQKIEGKAARVWKRTISELFGLFRWAGPERGHGAIVHQRGAVPVPRSRP